MSTDESLYNNVSRDREKTCRYIYKAFFLVNLGVFLYDYLYKTGLASNVRLVTIISFVLIGVVVYLMKEWAGFSYRSFNIHLGALFGTNMAFNVWFRIWPAQQKIITAIKNGEAPEADLVGLAGLRSKHNTYMSVPLIWTMMNQHTTVLAGGNFGITSSTITNRFFL